MRTCRMLSTESMLFGFCVRACRRRISSVRSYFQSELTVPVDTSRLTDYEYLPSKLVVDRCQLMTGNEDREVGHDDVLLQVAQDERT